uniref:Uncharacterized protein n=1 Tax=Romanomermis culicivorax TaxID=13658 RepID=A0A915LD19_ROMCU
MESRDWLMRIMINNVISGIAVDAAQEAKKKLCQWHKKNFLLETSWKLRKGQCSDDEEDQTEPEDINIIRIGSGSKKNWFSGSGSKNLSGYPATDPDWATGPIPNVK